MTAIKFKNNQLSYLDQTQLPSQEIWRVCRSLEDGYRAIKTLRVRGAPLLGVFVAYVVVVASEKIPSQKKVFLKRFQEAVARLKTARPTAVNLFWALERLEQVVIKNKEESVSYIREVLRTEAKAIHKEDISLCTQMAGHGIKLIAKGDRILTHCNTGFLATSGEGTALAVIYKAHRDIGDIKVYVDETRPLLQGARLTAWELTKQNIPCTLICDNMAASLMQRKEIDKIIVGADRITAHGDVANKIGTYSLAVLAHYHNLPFYVVAPFSSFDVTLQDASSIPIEQRDEGEVKKVLKKVLITPEGMSVYNPAFDVTPHRLIRAIVTDQGILYPPYGESIKKMLMPEGG